MVDDIVLLMFVQMGKILNAECTMYIWVSNIQSCRKKIYMVVNMQFMFSEWWQGIFKWLFDKIGRKKINRWISSTASKMFVIVLLFQMKVKCQMLTWKIL